MNIAKLDTKIDRLFELVKRDHGGCDQASCSLAHAIENGEVYIAIHLWDCSGAADTEFLRLYKGAVVRHVNRMLWENV